MSGAVKVVFVTGVIDREHIGIPFDVPEYEVAVLEEIHGELNVRETGEHEMAVDGLTAATAYAQLKAKYSGHIKDVRQVYRSVRELARRTGLTYNQGDDEAEKYQEAEQNVAGKKVKGGRKGREPAQGDDEAAGGDAND